MRLFKCDCGNPVFFENTVCLACGATMGFDPASRAMVSSEPTGEGNLKRKRAGGSDAPEFKNCRNLDACGCNWLLRASSANRLCDACVTTRTIPARTPQSQSRWQRVEAAKRRLLLTLLDLELWGPESRVRPVIPLQFDLLEPYPGQPVTTGHANGIITLDIAEADDDARERTRVSLHEPYRTLVGHFRHEVGHFYWELLIKNTPHLEAFRQLFGDETADYAASLQRHYAEGPPPGWAANYVSAYATMHPWEDWAESWAHYMHMFDTLDTADNAALSSRMPGAMHEAGSFIGIGGATQGNAVDFTCRIERWTSVGILCNELSRSMGQPDVYPFGLMLPVLRKLFFIERVISKVRLGSA